MKFFNDRGFWSNTVRLALPIALQNLLVSSYALVDTLMVGQLGDVALSAVGMAGQWNWLMNLFIFGVCSGSAVFFAQFWGSRDRDGIHKTFGVGFSATVLIALFFFFVGALFPEGVIRLFNQDPAVVEAGVSYLQIAAFSYLAAALNTLFCTLLRSTEEVRLPVFVSLITTVLNTLLDYALILGKFGFPRMGVEGAALATCISAWSGPVLLLICSVVRRNMLMVSPKAMFGFTGQDVRRFFQKAVPVIFNEGMWGLGTVLFQIIYANLGYEYYAAVTILRTFENIAFVFFVGLCDACSVMVGKSIGSGRIRRGVTDARRFTLLLPAVSVVLGWVIILCRRQLIGIFNLGGTITETTLQTAMTLLLIYGIHIGVRNVGYVQVVGIFRSGGETVKGVVYDLIALWGVSLPVTFLCAYVWKLPFPAVYWIMYLCEDWPKAILCLRYFRTLRWIKPVTREGVLGLEEYKTQPHKFFETE